MHPLTCMASKQACPHHRLPAHMHPFSIAAPGPARRPPPVHARTHECLPACMHAWACLEGQALEHHSSGLPRRAPMDLQPQTEHTDTVCKLGTAGSVHSGAATCPSRLVHAARRGQGRMHACMHASCAAGACTQSQDPSAAVPHLPQAGISSMAHWEACMLRCTQACMRTGTDSGRECGAVQYLLQVAQHVPARSVVGHVQQRVERALTHAAPAHAVCMHAGTSTHAPTRAGAGRHAAARAAAHAPFRTRMDQQAALATIKVRWRTVV